MTDQQKALAVWRVGRDVPPPGHSRPTSSSTTRRTRTTRSRIFNVYGYGHCCCASANVEALARYAGLEARGWGITGHSVPEVNVGGHWCMLDASLINYFKKPDGIDRRRRGDQPEHRRLVRRSIPDYQRQRRQAPAVHARATAGRTARRSSPAAPVTTTTAGFPPPRTAGTARCRSSAPEEELRLRIRLAPSATRSTSSSARARSSSATGRTRACTSTCSTAAHRLPDESCRAGPASLLAGPGRSGPAASATGR